MRNDKQSKKIKGIILLIVIILLIYIIPNMGIGGNKVEKVRQKIEESLLEKYGEEFVVDRIGMRSAVGEKFYQARIYPKSHIEKDGTRDKYYYGTSSINVKSFGRLSKGVGDSYWIITKNEDVEKYLKPKVKEIFGDRVRLKADVEHEVTGDGSWWAGYKSGSLKKMNEKLKKDPQHNRILLTLYIYIFDKIDNEEEKEKRRKEIFEYINYLKEEGLFEYLEMGVIFIDERVLAPSYEKYKREIFITKKEEVEVEGKTVYLPPMKLRKEMSKVLGEEVTKMSEEEMIKNMEGIQKEDLSYKGIKKSNAQKVARILSLKMLKEEYGTSYEKREKNNELERYKYNQIENIRILKNLEYIY